MTVRYYDITDTNYPPVMTAVINSVLYFLAQTLYPDENPDDLIDPESTKRKFILANFDASEETAIYRAIEDLKTVSTSSGKFPFTAYNFSEEELMSETKSHLQVSGKVFSETVQGYVQAIPLIWDVPCITFTNNVQDYFRTRQIVSGKASTLTRLTVPININGVLTSFSVDVNFEITKGSYAYQYEEYLSKGRLYDLMHPLKLKFMYLILNTSDVSPVDNITVALNTLASTTRATEQIQEVDSSSTPTVSSTVPVADTTDVDKTQSVVINFNIAMNEGLTNSYIDIEPMFPCNFVWNDASTQLTLQPLSGELEANTEYVITVEKESQSFYQAPLEEDYIFSFTTGV